jgi:hypothetical protein
MKISAPFCKVNHTRHPSFDDYGAGFKLSFTPTDQAPVSIDLYARFMGNILQFIKIEMNADDDLDTPPSEAAMRFIGKTQDCIIEISTFIQKMSAKDVSPHEIYQMVGGSLINKQRQEEILSGLQNKVKSTTPIVVLDIFNGTHFCAHGKVFDSFSDLMCLTEALFVDPVVVIRTNADINLNHWNHLIGMGIEYVPASAQAGNSGQSPEGALNGLTVHISAPTKDAFYQASKKLMGEEAFNNHMTSHWTPHQICRDVAEKSFVNKLQSDDKSALDLVQWVANNLWKDGITGLK